METAGTRAEKGSRQGKVQEDSSPTDEVLQDLIMEEAPLSSTTLISLLAPSCLSLTNNHTQTEKLITFTKPLTEAYKASFEQPFFASSIPSIAAEA